jgi:hypothetical protein
LSHPLAAKREASLFILDDEGVFFFAPRRELYVFNTAATFLWCCVEEAFSADETVELYCDRFAAPRADAERQIADLLNGWWSLGYIDPPGIEPATDISLTTALGRLLANPSLRTQFASSPADTARMLRLRDVDAEAFLALNPQQIEAQALACQPRRERQEDIARGIPTLFSAVVEGRERLSQYAARCRVSTLAVPVFERHYRILGTHFGLRFSSREQLDTIHPALAQMAIATPTQTHVWLDLAEGENGHVIVDGALPLDVARGITDLAPRVKNLLRQIALDREAFFVELHAGVVSDGAHCIVLPAAPGSGKTTLTAGLVHSGFDYFSDEVALLDEETLSLRPVPLGLGIKPGAVDVLADRFPVLRDLQVHSREDGRQVRYLCLTPDQVAPHDAKRDARWLIFPRFAPEATTKLLPIGRPTALRRLMHECLVLPKLLDEPRVEKLVQWMRRLDCYELPMSSLDEAVGCVRQVCRRAA